MNFFQGVLFSLLAHVFVMVLMFKDASQPIGKVAEQSKTPVNVIVVENHPAGKSSESTMKNQSEAAKKVIDLQPSFVKDGLYAKEESDGEGDAETAFHGIHGFARELLFTESKVSAAFDQLASKINVHLDYPDILAENGVQGYSTLELYFDNDGNVDERQSEIRGNHGSLRGLLTRAAREGLIDWYKSDAVRLEKHKFRNQHFRADFYISYSLSSSSDLQRAESGEYKFLRRKNVPTCLSPAGGGLSIDITCAFVKLGGVVKRSVSDKYKGKLMALTDILEYYDRAELTGINAEIQKSS